MKFEKNLFSEIIFSVFIAIILAMDTSKFLSEVDYLISLQLQSLAVYFVFFLWIKNISQNFSKKGWIIYTHGPKSSFLKSVFRIYKPFNESFLLPKTPVLIIVFILSELILQPHTDINLSRLNIILLQFFNTSLYFLMSLYISFCFKTYWKKLFVIFGFILLPFLFSTLILDFANAENYKLLLIFPSNLFLSIKIGFSVFYFLIGFSLFIIGIFISVELTRKRLKNNRLYLLQ